MHVRGRDLGPAPLVCDLVEETHHGWKAHGYPDRPRSLGALLGRTVARCPDREAVVTPSERVTWREFDARVRRLAAGLQGRRAVMEHQGVAKSEDPVGGLGMAGRAAAAGEASGSVGGPSGSEERRSLPPSSIK